MISKTLKTKVAGELASRMAGDIAQQMEWEDGSPQKIVLHAVAGALAAKTSGGNVAVGAASGAASEWLNTEVTNLLEEKSKDYGLSPSDKESIRKGLQRFSALAIGAAVGGEVGGNTESAMQGAATAYNAEANNRQLHPNEMKWIKEHASEFANQLGISEEEAFNRLVIQAAQEVDFAWFKKINETDDKAQIFLRGAYSSSSDVPDFDDINKGTFIDGDGRRQRMFTATKDDYYSTSKYSKELAAYDKANNQVVTKLLQPEIKNNLYAKALQDGAKTGALGLVHTLDNPKETLSSINFGIANCLKEDMCFSAVGNTISDATGTIFSSAKEILGYGYNRADVDYLYGQYMANEIDAIALVRGGAATLELLPYGLAKKLPVVGKTTGYNTVEFNYEAHNLVNYEKYKQQLKQENLENIAKLHPELSHAALGENNFTYKDKIFTKEYSDDLGKAWVGPNYTQTSQGGLISEDGTRQYRPPTNKKYSNYAETGMQSNFERFYIDPVTGMSKRKSNLHLNIYEEKR